MGPSKEYYLLIFFVSIGLVCPFRWTRVGRNQVSGWSLSAKRTNNIQQPFAVSSISSSENSMTTPNSNWLLRFDGGSRGNPGLGGAGAVLYWKQTLPDSTGSNTKQRLLGSNGYDLDEVWAGHLYLGYNPPVTSNIAEYNGLIYGLKNFLAQTIFGDSECEEHLHSVQNDLNANHHRRRSCLKLDIEGDSQLVINQLLGLFAVKSPHLQDLYRETKALLSALPRDQVTITHIPRSFNTRADELSNQAMDSRRTSYQVNDQRLQRALARLKQEYVDEHTLSSHTLSQPPRKSASTTSSKKKTFCNLVETARVKKDVIRVIPIVTVQSEDQQIEKYVLVAEYLLSPPQTTATAKGYSNDADNHVQKTRLSFLTFDKPSNYELLLNKLMKQLKRQKTKTVRELGTSATSDESQSIAMKELTLTDDNDLASTERKSVELLTKQLLFPSTSKRESKKTEDLTSAIWMLYFAVNPLQVSRNREFQVTMCSNSVAMESLNESLRKLNIKLSKPLKAKKRTNNDIFPKDLREIGIQKLALINYSDLWEVIQRFQHDDSTEERVDPILYGWALK